MANGDFIVAEECVRLGLRAGAILFRHVQVGPARSALRAEIAAEVRRIREEVVDVEAVRSDPAVMAFRAILKKVGIHPRKEQPSVERLLNFALKRGDLPAVNNLVDAYNLVSVRSLCSLGAHDFDTVAAPVALRFLTGRESFTPLGRATQIAVAAGEYGYVDAQDRVLCRLDVLQADFSKVTANTTNAFLIIEGTTAHTPELLRQTFADAIEVVTRWCGGEAEVICDPLDLSP
ncbi:MAG TPA: phenylalanine--tRNA ligase beta subunit-related protein [Gemmataceae bacterium]|nr:phenylalanine--tRNA ligase beta subunit-related protein [Gemmataceae bacterium]